MRFKSDLLQLSILRALLGFGVGFLFFSLANLTNNVIHAIGFFIVGVGLIGISTIGHRYLGKRAMER